MGNEGVVDENGRAVEHSIQQHKDQNVGQLQDKQSKPLGVARKQEPSPSPRRRMPSGLSASISPIESSAGSLNGGTRLHATENRPKPGDLPPRTAGAEAVQSQTAAIPNSLTATAQSNGQMSVAIAGRQSMTLGANVSHTASQVGVCRALPVGASAPASHGLAPQTITSVAPHLAHLAALQGSNNGAVPTFMRGQAALLDGMRTNLALQNPGGEPLAINQAPSTGRRHSIPFQVLGERIDSPPNPSAVNAILSARHSQSCMDVGPAPVPVTLPTQTLISDVVHVNFVQPGPLEMEIDEWFKVIRVVPGGQADQMGVRTGYKMIAFNGTPTASATLSTCMNNVRVTPRPWTFTFQVPVEMQPAPATEKAALMTTCEHEESRMAVLQSSRSEQQTPNVQQLLPPQTAATAGTASQMQHAEATDGTMGNGATIHIPRTDSQLLQMQFSQQQQSYQHNMQKQSYLKPSKAASTKDARVTKDGTLALTRPQINIANHVLTTKYFKPEMGTEQWTRDEKQMIVTDINREMVAFHLEPSYTLQKLEQWQGNALYRYRCIKRNQKPESWQGAHARTARSAQSKDGESTAVRSSKHSQSGEANDEIAESDLDDGMMESEWSAEEIAEYRAYKLQTSSQMQRSRDRDPVRSEEDVRELAEKPRYIAAKRSDGKDLSTRAGGSSPSSRNGSSSKNVAGQAKSSSSLKRQKTGSHAPAVVRRQQQQAGQAEETEEEQELETAEFNVGDHVHAVYPGDGKLYPARIAEVLPSGYLIDWDDGTTEHRRRKRNEVLAMTAVLIDTTFFQTADALVQYMKSLGKVECKTLCGMVRLSTSGGIPKMRNRLVRAVAQNLGLMQLATVCYCWNDISSILAANLQTAHHPDVTILDKLRDADAEDLDDTVQQYKMVMHGELPRFVIASSQNLRRMKAAKPQGTGAATADLQQQLAGPRGGGLKRKKRKGKWA